MIPCADFEVRVKQNRGTPRSLLSRGTPSKSESNTTAKLRPLAGVRARRTACHIGDFFPKKSYWSLVNPTPNRPMRSRC
jgi:hypothetical protein